MEQALGIVGGESRPIWLRGARAKLGVAGGALLLFAVATGLLFRNILVNELVKPRVLRFFYLAHPGCSLEIAQIDYQLFKSRTVLRGIAFRNAPSNWSCRIGQLSFQGVPWLSAILGDGKPSPLLLQASMQASNVVFDFPKYQHRLVLGRVRVSMPDAQISAADVSFRPLDTDAQFFAAYPFRHARFRLTVPRCTVSGIDSQELLAGRAYRAKRFELEEPWLDTVIDADKPLNPRPAIPRMPNQILNAIPQLVEVQALEVRDGRITIREVLSGSEPGFLSFDALQMSVRGIANRPTAQGPATLTGEAKLMNAGTLSASMQYPLASPGLSFRYAATLTAMDLRSLNSFLSVVGHTRIKSGNLQSAACQIDVTAGHAIGTFQAIYRDLDVAILNRQTRTESGVGPHLKTFFVDHVAMHTSNTPDHPDSFKVGTVDYIRKPEEKFLHLVWFAIRSGMFDLLGMSEFVKNPH